MTHLPVRPVDTFDCRRDIRVIRAPTVYLVGRQVVAADEVERFLADHGVSWQTDSEVAGEYLVEIGGRLCYMSFARPRPGGNKAYLDHILEVGHGSVVEHAVWNFVFVGVSRSLTHELVRHRAGMGYCLTGDTLIYSEHACQGHRQGAKKRSLRQLFEMTRTPHGRSRIPLLRLRCLDEKTGAFTTGKVARIAASGVKPVFRVTLVDGKTITCSRDHRFLTPSGWLPLHQIVGGLDVSPGGLAYHGPLDLTVAVNGILAYRDRAWLHEQYVEQGLEQEVIAQLAGVSEHTIRAWVRKHGLQKPLGSWTKGRAPWNKGRRYRAGWKHTPETRRLLSEQKRGENNPAWRGGITRLGGQLRRGVEDLAPLVFQRDNYICRLCGVRGGSLQVHHVLPIWARPDLVLEMENLATLCEACHHQVNGHELEYAERLGASPPAVAALAGKEPPRGRRLLVPRFRRIRSVVYAGCQETFDIEMEGPHHNFVANGIVTHNSQLSQRYVDESVAEYVEPDVIAADDELHALWLDAVGHAHAAYVKLVERLQERYAGEPDRTLRRKLARQAARSVLPNATETKIFVTANARALRHFIEMRASRHAEVEIRKLAIEVLRIMQREAPNLFADYQIVPLPDGTYEASTPHRKV
jgi:thymidylate synthase ThyX/5-methylcytosine-specific restriction endonuclease McrA